MLLPTPPYPQWLAVFPNIAASRGVLVPVQAAMVEIFLFPVGVRSGNRLHSSTKRLAARARRQPWQCTLLRTLQQHRQLAQQAASKSIPQREPLHEKQERAAKPAVPSWPCSPRLPDHPRRNWPQNPLHHGQVLPVVMRLRERNIKGRHGTDSSRSTSSPVQNPLLGNTSVISTRLQ